MSEQSMSKQPQSGKVLKQQRLSSSVPRLSLLAGMLMSVLFVMPTAQAASCKIPKSYYKNVACTAASGSFLATTDFGAPVALINNKGKRIIDLSRYQRVDANKISEGLLPVLRNGRVGYVNMQGREVVPAIYERFKGNQGWARPVSEGRIIVKRNGDYGVITTTNQTIVPFSSIITDIDNYQGGVARVRRNQSTSWLDKNGKTTGDPNSNTNNDELSAASNASIPSNKANAAQKMPFTTLQPHQQDGRWGFVDDNNVTMITYSFDEVRPFSEGLAGVRVNEKWGFVNLGGELVIPFRFEDSGVAANVDAIIDERLNASNNENVNNDDEDNRVSDDFRARASSESLVSDKDLDADKSLNTKNTAQGKVAANNDSYKGAAAFVFKEGKAWVGNLKNGDKICIDTKGADVSCG